MLCRLGQNLSKSLIGIMDLYSAPVGVVLLTIAPICHGVHVCQQPR
jgi:hypothetical protein